jgi:hypothetical protein
MLTWSRFPFSMYSFHRFIYFDSRIPWLRIICCAFHCRLSFRHRSSWQDAGRIKLHRADLIRFVYELSTRLHVHFETPPPRRLLYHGGTLAHGQVLDFKRNLLVGDNIVSQSKDMCGLDNISTSLNRPVNVSRDYSSTEAVLQGE